MTLGAPAALGLGAVAYAASWGFGSRPLAVVGIGLALAGALGLAWGWWARGPLRLTEEVEPAPAVEDDDVRVRLELTRRRPVPFASVSLRGSWPRLGEREVELRGAGRTLRGELRLSGAPRGVHRTLTLEVVHEDPLGLDRRVRTLPPARPLVVRPRVACLDSLFADAVLSGPAARARRPSPGVAELRSVRPHRDGEPLRAVHWPTTARRGTLTVKELEEPAGGDTVILLDCDPVTAFGEPPDTPFDAAVRAAGTLAVTLARRGRGVLLITTGRAGWPVRVLPRAVEEALDALAAAEADSRASLAAALTRPEGQLAAARELLVVTARADAPAIAALRSRATALVWVDAGSWTGRGASFPSAFTPLAAAGIAVAALRRGDDVSTALAMPRRSSEAASG